MKSKRWSQYTRVKYPVSSSSLHPFNFFVPIVERVQEGVVSIVTEDAPLAKDVDSLIRSLIDHEDKSTTPLERSFGSGFIFHPRGYILTSEHVIGKSKKIFVKLFNGKIFEAKRIIADRVRDYAVIKIDADCKLYPLPLGNSSHTKVGEWVISVGSPLVVIAPKNRLLLNRQRVAPSAKLGGFACCGQDGAQTAPDARSLWHTCPSLLSGEKLRVPAWD